jgi:hypothetical protein
LKKLPAVSVRFPAKVGLEFNRRHGNNVLTTMKKLIPLCVLTVIVAGALPLHAAEQPAKSDGLVPLVLKLPAPAFKGTPKDLPEGLVVEPLSDKPRPALMVPAGCVNLVAGLKPTSSDTNSTPEKLAKITDGDKEAYETSIVLLRKGVQSVQFDLGKPAELHAIVIWHAHDTAKVYRNVVVQIADDAAFTKNVRTLYNNDSENKAGQGVGTDRQYFETNEGRLVPAKGEKAQFVRLWSRGSTESALNEYTEVEVWGKPAP